MKTLHGEVDGQFSPLERTHLADGGSQMFQTPEVDVFVVFAKAISSIRLNIAPDRTIILGLQIFLDLVCLFCLWQDRQDRQNWHFNLIFQVTRDWQLSQFMRCLSLFLSFCLSVFLSYCLSVSLSFCLSVSLPFCLSVFVSLCLSVFLCHIKSY